MSEIT